MKPPQAWRLGLPLEPRLKKRRKQVKIIFMKREFSALPFLPFAFWALFVNGSRSKYWGASRRGVFS